ncbi:hypothetical protein DFH28DRAFT_1094907 [Melampsora americana]|nr:hypothetical protein DFH28DRAFT_1094907 [Melampsora americana]
MSYLSLGLNLHAMFVMNPLCMFKKAAVTVSQSPQAAYDDLVARLHSSQKLITGPVSLTEEIVITSPLDNEHVIRKTSVLTTTALKLVHNDSDLETRLDTSFEDQDSHSCLDLSFDLEVSFGDRHLSVHLDNEFDLETCFQREGYFLTDDFYSLEPSIVARSMSRLGLSSFLQTSENLSHEEIPHIEIYNQMLEDLLGFSTLKPSEPTPVLPTSTLPHSLPSNKSITISPECHIQDLFDSRIDESIRSFPSSKSELSFDHQSDIFDLDLSGDDEASFGDQHLSVHMDEDFNVEFSFAGARVFHLDVSRCLEESFDVQNAIESLERNTELPVVKPLAQADIPHFEIYDQMLQDFLGPDLNPLEPFSTPSTASMAFIKPRRRRSSCLETLCSSRRVSLTSLESNLICDSRGSSLDPEKEKYSFQSTSNLIDKLFNSICIIDELVELETSSLSHSDQHFDLEIFLKIIDLDHSFDLNINLELEKY